MPLPQAGRRTIPACQTVVPVSVREMALFAKHAGLAADLARQVRAGYRQLLQLDRSKRGCVIPRVILGVEPFCYCVTLCTITLVIDLEFDSHGGT